MKYIKKERYDDLIIRLTAHRTDIQDVYLDKNFGYHYAKDIPSNWKVNEAINYIKVDLILRELKEDLRKINTLMELDNGCDYTEKEMGFESISCYQEYYDDEHRPSLESVKNYIENLIKVLERFITV